MSDSVTIARPYAKAVFNNALAERKLTEWSGYLCTLATVVQNALAVQFLTNPATTASQRSELLKEMVSLQSGKVDEQVGNFVDLLASNKRLLTLPDIMALYEAMRAEQEKTIIVNVSSFDELSSAQQQQLIETLGKRLQRQVKLNVTIDKELIGGAVIHADDLVIDGSVRGKIDKLRAGLVS